MTHRKTYHCWESMIQRCTNPKHPSFKHYGARSITVCTKWLSYKGFLEDMGEAPKGLSIDRIDNNKGYNKQNCRWANQLQQSWNSRKTKLLKYDGKELSIRGWGRYLKIPYTTICARLEYGWSIEEALSLPIHTRTRRTTEKYMEYKGETKFLTQWADDLGINYRTLLARIRRNWPKSLIFSTEKFKGGRYIKPKGKQK